MSQYPVRFGLKSCFLFVTVLAGVSAVFLHTPHSRKINRLRAAIQSGDSASVRAELEGFAESNPHVLSGQSALHYACQLDNEEVLQALVESGSDVDARDRFRHTPLHVAAAFGNLNVTQYLLTSGADSDARDDSNSTPATVAATRGHRQIAAMIRRRQGEAAAERDIAVGQLRLKVGGYLLDPDQSQRCAKYIKETFSIHIEDVGCDLSDTEFMDGYNSRMTLAVMERFGRTIESIYEEAARQSALK